MRGPRQNPIIPLDAEVKADIDQVGGKALSLITLKKQNFPVPAGFVLTADFFRPWLKQVDNCPEWAAVLASTPENLAERCEAVKALSQSFTLDLRRRQLLDEALERLTGDGSESTVAVRSSSPEEDLLGTSFAGAYETLLGVRAANVNQAIHQAFASCLDARVWRYKEGHGLDPRTPRIAVIIQQQVAADAAGVAFSLNPQNNSYDEVVINANYGLGESVVSGLASPDSYIVDKQSGRILVSKRGNKEVTVRLDPAGGTFWESVTGAPPLSLTERQVGRITCMATQVEALYGAPVDIEWALAGQTLFLLQARPITAYFPIPAEMQSEPGEPKFLYLDYTLAKQGVDYPLSVLGSEIWERIQRAALKGLPDEACRAGDGLMFSLGGRFYSNLSYYFKMQGRERTAAQIRLQDTVASEIIKRADQAYTARELPHSMRGVIPRMLLQRVGTLIPALRAIWRPEAWQERFHRETDRLGPTLEQEAARDLPPQELVERLVALQDRYMSQIAIPATIAAELARSRIKKLFQGDQALREQASYLERALPHNVTIQMGLDLARLAAAWGLARCTSPQELASRLRDGAFPPTVLVTWEEFVQRYGHRGARELDIATARCREDPGQLYDQLVALAADPEGEHSPREVFQRGLEEREAAYSAMREAAGSPGRRRQLRRLYRALVSFGAFKEINKSVIIKVVDLVRKRMLREAAHLAEAGRLDSLEQVFDLTLEQLERGLADPDLDLRELAHHNTRHHRLFGHVRDFPRIFDSRGRILRAPLRRSEGGEEILGEPISPGVVQGAVKVMHNPTEKPLLPGEILVARATDPGWTSLFVSAAGIVLEVGGVLQHGAVVARVYGKPCVVGIDGATALFQDGEIIQVDGANGAIRKIQTADATMSERHQVPSHASPVPTALHF